MYIIVVAKRTRSMAVSFPLAVGEVVKSPITHTSNPISLGLIHMVRRLLEPCCSVALSDRESDVASDKAVREDQDLSRTGHGAGSPCVHHWKLSPAAAPL